MRIFLLLHSIIIYVERFLSQTPSEKLAETNCFARCGIMEPAMTPTGKVIGGHTSTGSSYPWETHIQGVFECGGHKPIEISSTGFVIDPKVILTTAHSMFYETKLIKEACPIPGFIFDEFVELFAPKWTQFQPNEVKVHIGAVTMGDIQQGNSTVVEVEKIIIREGFNMRGTDQLYAYDLAALILKEPLELGPELRKVCIPDATFSETKGSMAHLSGWDKYKTNSATSNKVSEFRDETSVPYESTDICNVIYSAHGYTSANFICARGAQRGFSEGDSGAPLNTFKNGRWYATAMAATTMTKKLDRSEFPDAYVRLSAHCHWLDIAVGVKCVSYFEKPDTTCTRVLFDRQLRLWREKCVNAKTKPAECSGPPIKVSKSKARIQF